MVVQNPADPLWVLTIQILLSNQPSMVLGADGRPAALTGTYGPAQTITAHGPDAATAEAYVKQQNPGCLVLGAVAA